MSRRPRRSMVLADMPASPPCHSSVPPCSRPSRPSLRRPKGAGLARHSTRRRWICVAGMKEGLREGPNQGSSLREVKRSEGAERARVPVPIPARCRAVGYLAQTDMWRRLRQDACGAQSTTSYATYVRITTKPDSEYDRSRTVVRAIADSSPTKPDSATHRRVQRVTRRCPCQVCHA